MFALYYTEFVAATTRVCGKPTFFGLKPWYQYLKITGSPPNCNIQGFGNSSADLGGNSPFLLIGLAVLDDLIRIAALVAVGYVIYGGIQYITSQGSPDATSKARQTLINALIGLAVAVIATSIVTFIGNKLGNLSS